MGKRGKIDSKKLGLELGLILSRYLFDTEDLHFGYWPSDLEIKAMNLAEAQENHSKIILNHLPIDSGDLLDVGCGVGNFGRKLIDRGFRVDGVIPSAYLAQRVREVFGQPSEVFECKYEDLTTDKRYDLILFSESFQYVNIEAGLKKTAELLKPGGHLLICDFFQQEVEGKSPVRGGHKWSQFQSALALSPFEMVKDIDITLETGRTLDLVNDVMLEVGAPIRDLLGDTLKARHPLLSKLLYWKFKKKIEKTNRKYFSGRMSSEAFLRHITYRLLVYQ